MRYARVVSKKKTPQWEPIPGEAQVMNSAGGYVYALDDWARLRRFLILGTEGGSYYATERELTLKNAQCVLACVAEDGRRTVDEIVEISMSGRAPKNDPAVFALALCLAHGSDETKRHACGAVPKVCRIGTHLFHFVDAANEMRGWGKMLRQAVSGWYDSKPAKELAFQLVKYKQRDEWSHRDLLRLAHVKPSDELNSKLFQWVTKDEFQAEQFAGTEADLVWAAEQAKTADKPAHVKLIQEHNLPRETVPTQFLTDPDVWAAMLPSMGLTAMIRSLTNMSRCGLLDPGGSQAGNWIISRVTDGEQLAKARIHPIQVLSALKVYAQGTGVRSHGAGWVPSQKIVDALDEAFYKAFRNVKPSGKRHMLALDVSGSMTMGEIAGVPGLTPRVASAAMAMVTLAVEKDVQTVAFTSTHDSFIVGDGRSVYAGYKAGISPIALSSRRRLDDVVKYVESLQFGGTDCSLPMLYALEKKAMVDVFVVYTDNETWAGNIHPVQALRQYRERLNPEARLIVVGMVSNGFSIADPDDAGMMDVVGFDASAPAVMADFAGGAV